MINSFAVLDRQLGGEITHVRAVIQPHLRHGVAGEIDQPALALRLHHHFAPHAAPGVLPIHAARPLRLRPLRQPLAQQVHVVLRFVIVRRQRQIGLRLEQFAGVHQRQRHVVVGRGDGLLAQAAKLAPGRLIAKDVGSVGVILPLIGLFSQLGVARHLLAVGGDVRLVNVRPGPGAGEDAAGQQQGNPSLHRLSFLQKFGASITARRRSVCRNCAHLRTADDSTALFQTVSEVKTAYSRGLFVTGPRPMLNKMPQLTSRYERNPLQKHAVWQLIKPFWVSEERWRAWMMLIAIVVLSLGLVYISVQINQWNQVFYDALQNKNYPVFKAQLWRFTYLALIFIVLAVYKIYLTQGLQMRWRRWMTEKFMEKWLAHQAYYHTEQQQIVDNPDQRIAEDLNVLTQYTLSLSLGLLSSLVTLFSFIDILWHVSGPMTFALGQHAITLPGYMVWFALLYAVLGSLLIWWVGKPLVMLGFNQERYEANFRFGLIRIRENNDAIALYHGEPREAQQLGDRFDTIRSNWWAIMRITRRLNIATNFYGQFAIVFPPAGGSAALLLRRHSDGRPDADRLGLRPGAGCAVMVYRRI